MAKLRDSGIRANAVTSPPRISTVSSFGLFSAARTVAGFGWAEVGCVDCSGTQ